jgi:cytochrome P450
MPPWNWLTGHLPFLRAHFSRYPPDVLMSLAIKDIYREHFTSTEMFYLDPWPFVAPTLIVCNPEASYYVNRTLNIKPDVYVNQFDAQSGGPSLLSTNGPQWKIWRSLLSPGFAPGYLMGKVGEIVEGAETFSKILDRHAREKSIFRLEMATMRFTLDTIMKISL